MTQAGASTSTLERVEVKPKPPLRHYVCNCQLDKDPGFARCGVKVAGKATSSHGIAAMDLCAMCSEMRWSGTPCQFCGEIPGISLGGGGIPLGGGKP